MDGLYDYEISYLSTSLCLVGSCLIFPSVDATTRSKRDLIVTTLSFSANHKTGRGILSSFFFYQLLVLGEIPESFYSGRGHTILSIFIIQYSQIDGGEKS